MRQRVSITLLKLFLLPANEMVAQDTAAVGVMDEEMDEELSTPVGKAEARPRAFNAQGYIGSRTHP